MHGMGRGVGNLCTELLTDYINSNIGQRYSMDYDAVRKKNDDISKQLKLALSEVKYELLTPSKYEI